MCFPIHTSHRINELLEEKEVWTIQLLGSIEYISFMWTPDADLCVITVTAGQAEIAALATTSAETLSLSICSKLTDFFFFFTRSQSQHYLHRDPITKTATSFPLTATQNGLSQRHGGTNWNFWPFTRQNQRQSEETDHSHKSRLYQYKNNMKQYCSS